MKPQFTPEQLREMAELKALFPYASESTLMANMKEDKPIWKMTPEQRFAEELKGHSIMDGVNTQHQPTIAATAPPSSPKSVKGVDRAEAKEQRDFAGWMAHHKDELFFTWSRTDKRTTTRRGTPDFCVTGAGKVIYLEFKAKHGRLSDEQQDCIRWIMQTGTRACIVYSALEAIEITREHFGIEVNI